MTSNDAPEYLIGFLLRKAHRRAAVAFADALEPMDISGRHFGVLNGLAQFGPMSQRELIDHISSDKASMVRTVDDLETAGLARRELSPDDRRIRQVTITDQGRSTLAQAQKIAHGVTKDLLAHLTPDARQQLITLLDEFIHPPEHR